MKPSTTGNFEDQFEDEPFPGELLEYCVGDFLLSDGTSC